jgi:hypothetical protein
MQEYSLKGVVYFFMDRKFLSLDLKKEEKRILREKIKEKKHFT